MAVEPDNLILQYLRRFDARLARMEDDLQDVKVRLGSIESQIVGLHTEMTHVRGDVVHVLHRLDKTDERLLRIERRLDLVRIRAPAAGADRQPPDLRGFDGAPAAPRQPRRNPQ